MDSKLTVRIKQGLIRGKLVKTVNGKDSYHFLGIPYAKPPIGKLRFKDPIPFPEWENIRDAFTEGNCSAQYSPITQELIGSDDCLYLNVFTPKKKTSDEIKLPVIIYIHGGGFINGSGSPDTFGPDYILEKNIIIVSFNYRLGVLGFLCTDPVNARGDMGLKDQNLVLKWVKENIEYFGGDSNNITILGISAGSAATEYHILSPMSKNLFNKAILQSGSVLNPWARTRNPIKQALRLAKMFGYRSNTEGLFEFLNKIDSKSLVGASSILLKDEDFIDGVLYSFTPVVNEFKDDNGFLNEEPIELLKSGNFYKVPTISGLCDFEGMLILIFNNGKFIGDLNRGNYIKFIPSYMNKTIEGLDEKLRMLYNEKNNVKNNNDYIMNFYSDLEFNGGILGSLDQRLIHNPNDNYFYYFTYDGNLNTIKIMFNRKEKGACHVDDCGYLCVSKLIDTIPTPIDEMIRQKMVEMWTNFVKTGKPTPDATNPIEENWLPVTKDKFNYLEINIEMKVHMDAELFPERIKLWKKIYDL